MLTYLFRILLVVCTCVCLSLGKHIQPIENPTTNLLRYNKTALRAGKQGQNHHDEVFISLFNSSYEPPDAYYNPKIASYFARDGINVLFYHPSDCRQSIVNFLEQIEKLGMNGLVWLPKNWRFHGEDEAVYETVIKTALQKTNLYGWYMPDELPSVLMKTDMRRNPIYLPQNGLCDPDNISKPWFLNRDNPDDLRTVIGYTRWFGKMIKKADPESVLFFSPGNGGAMGDINNWAKVLEYNYEYIDVWIRGAYPNWVGRPRTMLIYETEQWLKAVEMTQSAGKDLSNEKFMLILESFPGPSTEPRNFIEPEIIRFDAYAALTLGSTGLLWWEGKNWNNSVIAAQKMYDAIKAVAKQINIAVGLNLAKCLLADEPPQSVKVRVLDGPIKAPLYLGRSYDSMQVRLKRESQNGSYYLFVANFAQYWSDRSKRSSGPHISARFTALPAEVKTATLVLDTRESAIVGKTINLNNGSFEAQLPGLTVRVYKLNR